MDVEEMYVTVAGVIVLSVSSEVKDTAVDELKPVPVIVTVCSVEPSIAIVAGLMLVIVGAWSNTTQSEPV